MDFMEDVLLDAGSTTTPPFSVEACCQDEWKESVGAVILSTIFVVSTAVTLYGVKSAFRPAVPTVPGFRPREFSYGTARTSFSSWGTVATQSSVGAGASYTERYGNLLVSSGHELNRMDSSDCLLDPEPEASLWLYSPPEKRPVDVRSGPGIDQPRTAKKLHPLEVFEVSETLDVPAEDGLPVRFLRLSSGAGWVFDRIPGHGVLCRRIPTLTLRVTPAKEHVGFKVHFPRPDTADDGGWPYVSALRGCEGGLREDDRIVRIDGLRIRDKAATRMLLHLAMQRSRQRDGPITIQVFRPEELEEQAAPPRSFDIETQRLELAASQQASSDEPRSRGSLSLTQPGGEGGD